ncbi:MAG TPA: PLP-dependent aminotransferase family protein [Steroidobacteraceae bacterium]
MRRSASAVAPVITLDRATDKPLHRQIYEGFRKAILERRLRPLQQIPSTRALASDLGISRIPILEAYSQLLAEGFLESRVGAGTFISSQLTAQLGASQSGSPGVPRVAVESTRPVSRASRALRLKLEPWMYGQGAFCIGQVATDHFPTDTWVRLVARHSRNVSGESLHFSDPRGSADLRAAITDYLRTARGVNCDAEQVIVVGGSQEALDISARVLLDPDSSVWLEEPGYNLARHALALAGCNLVPVPVDREGLNVAMGIKLGPAARAAYVTPSHQFPLGVTMSAARRIQLLNWAQTSDAWVIEDDYDSEYRYGGTPIASLQGLDANSRVIYIGTFSKTLFPSLRVGYLVVPKDLIDRFVAMRVAMSIYPPYLTQAVLADFINQGHFSRHIRRTRLLYAERRARLTQCLESEFGSELAVLEGESGMNLVVRLPEHARDVELARRAAGRGLWLWPLSPYYLGPPCKGFVLGFGNVQVGDMPAAVRRMGQVLRGALGVRAAESSLTE